MLYTEKDIIEDILDKRVLNRLQERIDYPFVYYGNSKEEVLRKANEDEDAAELSSLSFGDDKPFNITKVCNVNDYGEREYTEFDYSYIIFEKETKWIPLEFANKEDISLLLNSILRKNSTFTKILAIDSSVPNAILIESGEFVKRSPEDLLYNYHFIDGSPVGKEIVIS